MALLGMRMFFNTENGMMFWGSTQLAALVEELGEARRYVKFDDDASVDKVLGVITTIMRSRYRYPFLKSFFKFHYGLLKKRYELFKYVVSFSRVYHDPETNRMKVPFLMQEAIMHDNPAGERYFQNGEPIWDELRFMFDEAADWEDDPRIIEPDGEDDLFVIPNYFEINDVPLLSRMREREFKKIHNEQVMMARQHSMNTSG